MKNIQQIEIKVRRLATIIKAPESLIKIYDYPKGDGTPHIEIHKNEYHYVSSERGYEIFRKIVVDENELLFLVFQNITRAMAGDYELKNRDENQDCRKIIFSKMLELLGLIDSRWELRQGAIIDEILIRSPYDNE